jgi:hypothetical protein
MFKVTYEGKVIRISSDFSTATLNVKSAWNPSPRGK